MKPRESHHSNNGDLATAPALMLDTFQRNATHFAERLQKLQQEGIRFAAQRLEENTKALQTASACKTFPDLVLAHQKWLSDTARAYGEEWVRCGTLLVEDPPADRPSTAHHRH
jgi:hypothetical protein